MDKIKFDGGGGPEVAGGRANYDMQRLLFPPVDNPLFQPYAAFNTGQVLTLAVEALVDKLVAEKMAHLFGGMLRAQAEREAREEVARSLGRVQGRRCRRHISEELMRAVIAIALVAAMGGAEIERAQQVAGAARASGMQFHRRYVFDLQAIPSPRSR